ADLARHAAQAAKVRVERGQCSIAAGSFASPDERRPASRLFHSCFSLPVTTIPGQRPLLLYTIEGVFVHLYYVGTLAGTLVPEARAQKSDAHPVGSPVLAFPGFLDPEERGAPALYLCLLDYC